MTEPSPAASTARMSPQGETVRPNAPSVGTWLHWPLRRLLQRLVRQVACGSIDVKLPDGQRLSGRGALPGPHAAMVVQRWRTLWRLVLGGDIGLAESYRDGDWTSPDLPALLEFGIRNEAAWSGTLDASRPARWLGRAIHVARANTRRGSRQNIAFHYDLGNAFYARWLDPELIYSSALYTDPAQSLEQAQASKLERVAELLELDALPVKARVLEIGCGWGALALHLAQQHAAHVVGLTLSAQQLAHAQKRVADAGLSKQVDLRLQDYRDATGQFDRIVSIEMLEAVGERFWPVYFETLRQRLRPGGVAVVQVITIADAHFDKYRRGIDFIQRFIFPGGMLPSPGALQTAAARAGLVIETDVCFGRDYATTLVEWRSRFVNAWPQIAELGFDNAFRRLWEYYLCYCEAGFRSGKVDVGLYTLRHSATAV
ncbi:MAG: cyclopropane-fatty-acyl-phospholipid synthase family protein [Caldimonas sp.]